MATPAPAQTKHCECGCGSEIPAVTKNRRPARFKHGHNGVRSDWNAELKTCVRCGASKPRSEFHPDARCRDGLRSDCKDCFRANQRADQNKNARHRAWRRRNPDKVAEYSRRRYLKDPQAHYERQKRWRRENPERHREARRQLLARRRARKRGTQVEPIDVELLNVAGNVCGICGDPIEEPPHMDHIVPLAAGGTHTNDNVQWAHPSCNRRKGARVE